MMTHSSLTRQFVSSFVRRSLVDAPNSHHNTSWNSDWCNIKKYVCCFLLACLLYLLRAIQTFYQLSFILAHLNNFLLCHLSPRFSVTLGSCFCLCIAHPGDNLSCLYGNYASVEWEIRMRIQSIHTYILGMFAINRSLGLPFGMTQFEHKT